MYSFLSFEPTKLRPLGRVIVVSGSWPQSVFSRFRDCEGSRVSEGDEAPPPAFTVVLSVFFQTNREYCQKNKVDSEQQDPPAEQFDSDYSWSRSSDTGTVNFTSSPQSLSNLYLISPPSEAGQSFKIGKDKKKR